MSQFVVDANVAIKWVLPEVHSETAWRLLEPKYTCLLISLFPEIGNILWKRIRRGETTLENAQEDLEVLMSAALEVYPSLPLMGQALEVAVRTQQAVYDCVYLALAVNQSCQMVTADKRFFNALRNDMLFPFICWIEDLP